jgi:hypothetical protein
LSPGVAKTQIRLFWDLQENPGTTLRDAADRLGISHNAAMLAHSRINRREGSVSLSQFCPYCFKPTVMCSDVVRVCTSCGAELPYVRQAPRAPVGGHEYALNSVWNRNMGTDHNRTIVELRKTPSRGDDMYLAVLGSTHWNQLGGQGEDDDLTKKALEILFHRSQNISLPPPVYPKLDRLGIAVRKAVKEHSKLVERKEREARALKSTAAIEQIVDRVLRDALPGLGNL